jgi:hypothetical protein
MRFLMDMNKTPKKKAKKAEKEPMKAQPPAPAQGTEEDKPFDFGGLPNRDLKKNLGCG